MPGWNTGPVRPPGITPYGQRPSILSNPRPASELVPPEDGVTLTGGMDLRASFNTFIETYGQMVLVQRMNMKIHCTACWNEVEGEGNLDCPYCLGRGYLSVLERHISRRMSSDNEHKQQVLEQASPGPELVDSVFWYFEAFTNLAVEDIVYEVTWADLGKTLPQRLITAYRVNFSDPFRAAAGRIEYWRAACVARPIERDLVGEHLRRIDSHISNVPNDGLLRYTATYRS